jgi:hypothetical protein
MAIDKDCAMSRLCRVATVKATGKKYLVSYVDFRANKVVCWGELATFRGLGTRHEGTKAFLLEFVEISAEMPKTEALVTELMNQTFASKREEGHRVDVSTSRKGNIRYEIVPKKW